VFGEVGDDVPYEDIGSIVRVRWVGRRRGSSSRDAGCERERERERGRLTLRLIAFSRPALSRSPNCFLRAVIPRTFRVGLFDLKEWLERHDLSTQSRSNRVNEVLSVDSAVAAPVPHH